MTPQQVKETQTGTSQQGLPGIEDAFHLPIPAELTSRQQGKSLTEVSHSGSDVQLINQWN